MRNTILRLGAGVLVLTLAVPALRAAEPKAAAKTEKPSEMAAKPEKTAARSPSDSPASYTVKKQPFKIEVPLKGTFEAAKTAEILVRPEVWTGLEVVKAVEHGLAVKRGEVLIQFDLAKIDEEIADLQAKRALSDLAFKQAAENLKALEASTPLDLRAAERTQKIAHEDLSKFIKKDRALAEKSANFSLKSAENLLENQQDELNQLEKMYKADDLTEETEKIVLKRQQRAVEMAEFMVETSKASHDDTFKIDLPRRQETMEQNLQKQDITAAKAKVTLPLALNQARREHERLKLERTREEERLKKLLADREKLTVKAPISGVVYYGRFVRGKWSGMEAVADSLRRGGNVTKGAVLMTVVEPRPLFVRASVSEADLQKVRPEMKATVQPTAFPDLRLQASVAQVDAIPAGADSYEVRLDVRTDKKAEGIVPGMTCAVKVVSYEEKEALAVPAKAVFADEQDDRRSYVFLLAKGKARKQAVTVGKKTDDRVEIVRGLEDGDTILLERPKDEKPAKKAEPAAKEQVKEQVKEKAKEKATGDAAKPRKSGKKQGS